MRLWLLRAYSMIVIIGRGHSGTRILAHTLLTSGVFIGHHMNGAGDLIPAENMYAAAKIFAQNIGWTGSDWIFNDAISSEPIKAYKGFIHYYLKDILLHDEPRGFKLPETLLSFPWFTKMFPEAYYIYLVRDPRDVIIGSHTTDDITSFGIPAFGYTHTLHKRLESVLYQYRLMEESYKPKNFITVRYEDILRGNAIEELSEFLDMPLSHALVDQSKIGGWKKYENAEWINETVSYTMKRMMEKYGYE